MDNDLAKVIKFLEQIDMDSEKEASQALLEGAARLTSLSNKLFRDVNND